MIGCNLREAILESFLRHAPYGGKLSTATIRCCVGDLRIYRKTNEIRRELRKMEKAGFVMSVSHLGKLRWRLAQGSSK